MLDNQVLPFHNLGQRIKDLFRKKANKKRQIEHLTLSTLCSCLKILS